MAKYLDLFHPSWVENWKYLHSESCEKFMKSLDSLRLTEEVIPSKSKTFKMFQEIPYNNVKIIIIGNEPYTNVYEATGLGLSKEVLLPYTPVALNIVLDEIEREFHYKVNDLTLNHWWKQGIFNTNIALTVEQYNSGSHIELWKEFTKEFILEMSGKNIIFLFMGKEAQEFIKYTDFLLDDILTSSHPFTDSFGNPSFYGSGIFKKLINLTNQRNWSIKL